MSTTQPPLSAPPYTHHHPLRPHLLIPILTVTATSLSLLALLLLLSLLFYRRYRSTRTAPSSPLNLNPTPANLLRHFSFSHLRIATSSFAPSLKLGQGGFGSVYAGSLKSGEEIAVKLMDAGSLQGEREFQNEISLTEKMLDRKFVVLPIGYCVENRRNSLCRIVLKLKNDFGDGDGDDEGILGKRVLLVYELMHNGSLQDALLGKKCPELLDWGRRFGIALDIARGLEFLHEGCDPPVVHGDIKPSNILLDLRFNAKIADFGLARVKDNSQLDEGEEENVVVKIDEDSSSKNLKKEEEDIASESTITAGLEDASGIVAIDKSPDEFDAANEGDEMASTSELVGCDKMSVDSGKETAASSSTNMKRGFRKKGASSVGKDWWWRQDNNVGGNADSGGSVKDYVMEWIRSEIKKERPKSDWIMTPVVSSEDCLPKSLGRSERKKHQRRLEWWASLDEERLKKEKRSRPAREWWREEFCEELTKKQERKRMITKSKSSAGVGEKQHWWEEDDQDCALSSESNKKKRRKKKRKSLDWGIDSLSGDLKRTMTGRRRSQDWVSGIEVPKSGTISSTPSMRGTVCYVAPEYGGGGPLSEKCDIYSFGVLLLVLISGRRPLQVTASPMSEFERANLISWARHLAHLGRLIELVDPSIKSLDKGQALLCITVALLCIQRSPVNRPSIKEIVGMLTGQSEAPHLPFEFSPSPPGGFSFKSRKKGHG